MVPWNLEKIMKGGGERDYIAIENPWGGEVSALEEREKF